MREARTSGNARPGTLMPPFEPVPVPPLAPAPDVPSVGVKMRGEPPLVVGMVVGVAGVWRREGALVGDGAPARGCVAAIRAIREPRNAAVQCDVGGILYHDRARNP